MWQDIAEARGVVLRHPLEGHVSFTSSPYTPHLRWAAVDLSASTCFGSEVPSPVAGVVEKVVRLDCGLGPYSRVDYLVSIRVDRGPARVKLMHLEPCVKPGEGVEVGSTLGRYLRTNYFSYHHIPHVHVEVCRDSSLRPTRAMRLAPSTSLSRPAVDGGVLEVEVEEVGEGYALCSLVKPRHALGVPASLSGGGGCVLNGHLGVRAEYLGVLASREVRVGEEVKAGGGVVAYVKASWGSSAIALTRLRGSFKAWRRVVEQAYVSRSMAPLPSVEVCVEGGDGLSIRGVELLLSKTRPVKLIPWPRDRWRPSLEGVRLRLSFKLLSHPSRSTRPKLS